MKVLKFYEYGGYINDSGIETDSLDLIGLNRNEVRYLVSISDNLVPGKQIFNIGRNKIRANSLIGVLSLNNTLIEILPKLLRYNDQETNETSSILQNLMFMLSYTHSLEISDADISSLSQQHDSFIEAYISIFSKRLLRHLGRFGTPKAYLLRNENINTIKGKILFGHQATANPFDQSKIFCEYSEFTEDNITARAFKFVCKNLLKLTKNQTTFVTLNKCIGLLEGVEIANVNPTELRRAAVGKRCSNFIALIELTAMFLQKLQPDIHGKKRNKIFSLIFDMNELFEDFIFQVLRKHSKEMGIKVSAQKKKRLVTAERDLLTSESWVQRSLFDTYTDIHITTQHGHSFILDTKYKLLSLDRDHYGISNQDAYQILAYRQIHQNNKISPSVGLLYPQGTDQIMREFRVNGSDATFLAATINISRDLQSSMPALISDISKIISSESLRPIAKIREF